MKLYHATPRRNLASIFTDGLLTSKSETKRCAVYLFDSIKSVGWAKEHVAERHKCTIGDVVILQVFDGNPKLRRAAEILRMSGLPGIWYCTHDIPVGCIEVLEQE